MLTALLLVGLALLSESHAATVSCLNGGYVVTSVGEDACNCPPAYTGVVCETVVDDFSCLNGGSLIDSLTCSCPEGVAGVQCQHICDSTEFACTERCMEWAKICDAVANDCLENEDENRGCKDADALACKELNCLSPGMCSITNNTASCSCPSGYGGANCSVTCAETDHSCNSGCVPASLVCNGFSDCADGSDEDGCDIIPQNYYAQYNVPQNTILSLDVPKDPPLICNSPANTAPSRGIVYVSTGKQNVFDLNQESNEGCFSSDDDWFYYLGDLMEDDQFKVEFNIGSQFFKYRIDVFNPDTVDFCSVLNCENGGSCDVDSEGSTFCSCDEIYTGRTCEISCPSPSFQCSEKCLSYTEICDGVAVCKDGADEMTSECQQLRCEEENPCENGASCYLSAPDTRACFCSWGYEGTYCNTSITETTTFKDSTLTEIMTSYEDNTTPTMTSYEETTSAQAGCSTGVTCDPGWCFDRIDNSSQNYICVCPSGVAGTHCDRACKQGESACRDFCLSSELFCDGFYNCELDLTDELNCAENASGIHFTVSWSEPLHERFQVLALESELPSEQLYFDLLWTLFIDVFTPEVLEIRRDIIPVMSINVSLSSDLTISTAVEMYFSKPVVSSHIRTIIMNPVLGTTEYIGNMDSYRVVENTELKSEFTETTSEFTETTSGFTEATAEFTEATSEFAEATSEFTEATSEFTEATSEFTEATTELTETTSGFTEATAEFTEVTPEFTEATSEFAEATSEFTEATSEFTEATSEFTEATSEFTEATSEFTEFTEATSEFTEFTEATSEFTETSTVVPVLETQTEMAAEVSSTDRSGMKMTTDQTAEGTTMENQQTKTNEITEQSTYDEITDQSTYDGILDQSTYDEVTEQSTNYEYTHQNTDGTETTNTIISNTDNSTTIEVGLEGSTDDITLVSEELISYEESRLTTPVSEPYTEESGNTMDVTDSDDVIFSGYQDSTTDYSDMCGPGTLVNTCECEEFHYGPYCSLDIQASSCEDYLCENGGYCSDHDGKPNCTCQDNYAGRFCEKECGSNEFACELDCIPLAWRCDEHNDCYSGKDELRCVDCKNLEEKRLCGSPGDDEKTCVQIYECCYNQETGECLHNRNSQCYNFECLNGGICFGDFDFAACLCQPPYYGPDCGDVCESPNYRCEGTGGSCLSAEYVCDGEVHCEEASEETNCSESCSGFGCSDGQCVEQSWRCDGQEHCVDGSDEQNCECNANQFLCDGSHCLRADWKCDSFEDCNDGTDEQDCECSIDEFLCDGYRCIPRNYICDDYLDCEDETDELECENYMCPCAEPDFVTLGCNEYNMCMCHPGYSGPACDEYGCGENSRVEVFGFAMYEDDFEGPSLNGNAYCYEADTLYNATSMESCIDCGEFGSYYLDPYSNSFFHNPNVFLYSALENKCITYICEGWNLGYPVKEFPDGDITLTILVPEYQNPCMDHDCGTDGRCGLEKLVSSPYTAEGFFLEPVCKCYDGSYTVDQPCPDRPNAECETSPCLNGGVCEEGEAGVYSCDCPEGWYGDNCQINDPKYSYELEFELDLEFDGDLEVQTSDKYRALWTTLKQILSGNFYQIIIFKKAQFSKGSVVVAIEFGLLEPAGIFVLTDHFTQALEASDQLNYIYDTIYVKGGNLIRCSFEEDLEDEDCPFSPVLPTAPNAFNWTLQSGPTPSFRTGPYWADHGDYYMYAEASEPRRAGDFAEFDLGPLTGSGAMCLLFGYSMYGEDTGYLEVDAVYHSAFSQTVQTIFRTGLISVSEWLYAAVKISFGTGRRVSIRFRATVGSGSEGDIAVDDIRLSLSTSDCDTKYWFQEGIVCDPMSMLPKSDECLLAVWDYNCNDEGFGNPLIPENREFYNSVVLETVYWKSLSYWEKSNEQDTNAVLQCHGDFSSKQLRLVIGESTVNTHEGRLEVLLGEEWGTVCDDGFDDIAATVVCKQLGHAEGQMRVNAFYGAGEDMPIHLSTVVCKEQVTSLSQCRLSFEAGTCSHKEDVGVICTDENVDNQTTLGIPPDELATFSNLTDDTESAVFIPSVKEGIERSGSVIQWTTYLHQAVTRFYFQVWRSVGGNSFVLVGQTLIQNQPIGYHTYNLIESQEIEVREDDYIGFYFPGPNPLYWTSEVCYASNEQLRFVSDPLLNRNSVGLEYLFSVAPLAWQPCRKYFLTATIRNDPLTTVPPIMATTEPAPTLPPNALLFCGFEQGMVCEVGGPIEVRNSTGNADFSWLHKWQANMGNTSSRETGPNGAIRGLYYAYAEASDTKVHEKFIMATPPVLISDATFCISFLYHMYGLGIGSLTVSAEVTSSETSQKDDKISDDTTSKTSLREVLFTKSHSQSSEWQAFQNRTSAFRNMPFQMNTTTLQIVFTATMGENYQGDIAIDHVIVTPSTCPPLGVLPLSPARPESTSDNRTITPEVTQKLTLYVSPSGSGVSCSASNPCRDVEYALKQPALNKTIYFEPAKYNINISHLLSASTSGLFLHPNNSNDPVELTFSGQGPPLCLKFLTIDFVTIQGRLSLACLNDGSETYLNLKHVKHERMVFTIAESQSLFATITNSSYKDSFFDYTCSYNSLVTFQFCTFEGTLPLLDGTTVLTSSVPRELQFTGLRAYFPSKLSRNVLDITECTFKGLHQHLGTDKPLGGVTVYNVKTDSVVKINIRNSIFDSNERALDLSLKGDCDVTILNSKFFSNFANGSGGAVRLTASLQSGLAARSNVYRAYILIQNCEFSHNFAQTSSLYDIEEDVYYQTRSPGSGGAIYVYLIVPSQLLKDGLVDIQNSRFKNNTAEVQGGTIFVNPEISTSIENCNFSNTQLSWRPRFGDLLYASCNMSMIDNSIFVESTDGTTPILSYQAADAANYRLLLKNLTLQCPTGHWVEQLNTTSFVTGSSGALDTLQVYCRGCSTDQYSLNISSVTMNGNLATFANDVICTNCPYGAACNKGILNQDGFWGIQLLGSAVAGQTGTIAMYNCPEEYCVGDNSSLVLYNSCAENRGGILCGHCKEGYSESLFGTNCVPNSDCTWSNWWVLLLLCLYGIAYVLFFMFENDWERFIRWISMKFQRGKDKQELEDKNKVEDADMSQSGYFQIFMYFIQTSALLKVKIIVSENDEIYKQVYRPQDLLPDFLIDGVKEIFSFDISILQGRTCFLPDLDVVTKTGIKLLFVGYCFGLTLLMYVLSVGCCVFLPVKRRPKFGPLSNTARLLLTITSLFLYTYQSISEDALLLLNCKSVNNEDVLFYDGTVKCLQDWQYAVIALVVVFVIPFFIVLLFGPKLMDQKKIGVVFFFMACLFPLFLAVPVVLMYFGILQKDKKSNKQTGDDQQSVAEQDNSNFCCGSVDHIREELVDLLIGPYRDDIFKGVCYEGVLNFRRMVMVVLFTFITDILLKQMALAFTCFVILLIHIKAQPFKQAFSNYMETIALSLLLIISGTNLVKAAFYDSQTVPRGSNYLVVVIYEWLEAICLGILPLCIIFFIILAMVIKRGSKCCGSPKKDNNNVPFRNGRLRRYPFHIPETEFFPESNQRFDTMESSSSNYLNNNTRWRPNYKSRHSPQNTHFDDLYHISPRELEFDMNTTPKRLTRISGHVPEMTHSSLPRPKKHHSPTNNSNNYPHSKRLPRAKDDIHTENNFRTGPQLPRSEERIGSRKRTKLPRTKDDSDLFTQRRPSVENPMNIHHNLHPSANDRNTSPYHTLDNVKR